MATNSEVKALFDRQFDAIRAKDIDHLMAVYSPDIVYFDTVPPLQFAGLGALRTRFLEWFEGFQGPIDLEVRDLRLVVNGDLAVAYWFSRAGGTLKNGREVGSWVRATSTCRRSDTGWLIFHEHISWPVDVKSGSAVMNLVPSPLTPGPFPGTGKGNDD
jgi:ketosteroid isomerase-like protein